MKNTSQLIILKKEIDKTEDYGVPVTETRYFADTKDGFDGTAQGYGYKSPQALHKAYAYFTSKASRSNSTKQVKQFLAANPDVLKVLKDYFDESECLYRLKDNEPTSILNLISLIDKENTELLKKFTGNKSIWNALFKYAQSM